MANANMKAVRLEMQKAAEILDDVQQSHKESYKGSHKKSRQKLHTKSKRTLRRESRENTALQLDHLKTCLENITSNYESTVKKIEKSANDTIQIAIQNSMSLLKSQIEQRERDIRRASSRKKRHSGYKWLKRDIARWQEEIEKAEGEMRKLEWLSSA